MTAAELVAAPRVIGLDLSLEATGIAGAGWTDTIESKPPKLPPKQQPTLYQRHARLAELSSRIMDRIPADAVVIIEAPSLGQKRQAGTFDRAGLWWLVVEHLRRRGHVYAEVSPASVKKYATGKGTADKLAVVRAVDRRYDCLPRYVANDNEADAWILHCMGMRWLGHPVEQSLPLIHLSAMEGVHWPETPERAA